MTYREGCKKKGGSEEQGREARSGSFAAAISSAVPGSFVERPTALCWDRASGGSQPQWFVGATMRRVQGRIYHFQWKTSGDY